MLEPATSCQTFSKRWLGLAWQRFGVAGLSFGVAGLAGAGLAVLWSGSALEWLLLSLLEDADQLHEAMNFG